MSNLPYKKGIKVVYPAHGVGEISGVETSKYGGVELTTYVVNFQRDKMTLRIPVDRAAISGLRGLCTDKELESVNKTLKGRARASRGMWSRRAKEYEAKINSGNIISLAEVVRDLHRNVDDPERSYSERMIYENALGRLVGEISAVKKVDLNKAEDELIKTINENIPQEERKAKLTSLVNSDDDGISDSEEEQLAA